MLLHRSSQPILLPDRPWETGAALFAIAAMPDPDGRSIRLYYLVRGGPQGNVLCLARSTDARIWTKPDCGDGTNIVMRGAGLPMNWGEFMPAAVLHEPGDRAKSRRWKMIFWDRRTTGTPPGICLAVSKDGFAWQPVGRRPIITNANDAMSFIAALPGIATPLGAATHFIYQQTWRHNPTIPVERDNLKGMHRRISIWKGEGFTGRWVGPVTILEPDAEDPPGLQFYWLTPCPVAGGYGGLLNCHHTGDQTMDVQWVRSRDGWQWTRELNRQPLIPLGPRGGFDCGLVIAAAQPVRWQDRVLIFYNGRATVHDGQPRYPADPLPSPRQGIGLAAFSPALLD